MLLLLSSPGGPSGGFSGFQVTGLIELMEPKAKTPKKSLGLLAKPQKIPGPKIITHPKQSHLKVPEWGNAITQRKTLEIEHSCSV